MSGCGLTLHAKCANSSRNVSFARVAAGVFTELIEKIGVHGLQVEELYNLDVEDLKRISCVSAQLLVCDYVFFFFLSGSVVRHADRFTV